MKIIKNKHELSNYKGKYIIHYRKESTHFSEYIMIYENTNNRLKCIYKTDDEQHAFTTLKEFIDHASINMLWQIYVANSKEEILVEFPHLFFV